MIDTLYVSVDLLNNKEFHNWALCEGFSNVLDPKDFHCTIAFSKKEVNWEILTPNSKILKINHGARSVSKLGEAGTVVLKFESSELTDRWKNYIGKGCSWDWPQYIPHISISYNDTNIDLSKVAPYQGELIFGPEIIKKLDLG